MKCFTSKPKLNVWVKVEVFSFNSTLVTQKCEIQYFTPLWLREGHMATSHFFLTQMKNKKYYFCGGTNESMSRAQIWSTSLIKQIEESLLLWPEVFHLCLSTLSSPPPCLHYFIVFSYDTRLLLQTRDVPISCTEGQLSPGKCPVSVWII